MAKSAVPLLQCKGYLHYSFLEPTDSLYISCLTDLSVIFLQSQTLMEVLEFQVSCSFVLATWSGCNSYFHTFLVDKLYLRSKVATSNERRRTDDLPRRNHRPPDP